MYKSSLQFDLRSFDEKKNRTQIHIPHLYVYATRPFCHIFRMKLWNCFVFTSYHRKCWLQSFYDKRFPLRYLFLIRFDEKLDEICCFLHFFFGFNQIFIMIYSSSFKFKPFTEQNKWKLTIQTRMAMAMAKHQPMTTNEQKREK